MRKGIRPGTEKRCELLKIFLEKGMSPNIIRKYTSPMRGKTEAEKEKMAGELIKKFRTKSEPPR